jgi:uncharacterized delta-60 repeat protein
MTDINSGSYDYANSVALQNDGKIVTAGGSNNGNDDFAVVRYNTDGSLDNTFDSDGIVMTDINSGNDYAYSVVLQSDGKIVVAGYSISVADEYKFAVVRHNSDGTFDTSFDSDGITTENVGGLGDYGYCAAVQSDGKIVVGGSAANSASNLDFAVIRYDDIANGINPDPLQASELNVCPNPFSTQTILQTEHSLHDAILTIHNSSGQKVREINQINGQTVTLMRENLPVGIYFVQIMENSKITTSAKLIIAQ